MSTSPISIPVIACGQCEAENDRSREFCTSCGTPLWEACVVCDARVAGSERFCGNCGGNLAELLTEKAAEIDASLAEATRLEEEHRYDDSARMLRGIKQVSHSRFKETFASIEKSIERLNQQHRIYQEALESGLDRIRSLIERHAYRDAIKKLQSLPAVLREGEASDLLESATAKFSEVKELKAEIRRMVAAKEFFKLAPLIARFREVSPDDKNIDGLSQQIAQRVQRNAEKLQAKRQYDDVLNLIDAVPDGYSNPKLDKIFDAAREVEWLQQAIQFSPIADETLQAIAKRLVEANPENESAAEQLRKIRERAAEKPKDVTLPFNRWAAPPKRTQVGVPTEWLGGDQLIKPQDAAVNRVYRQHPGRFQSAVGLALQGLGRAAFDINLWVPEKRSVLNRLASRQPVGSTAWGIDLGDSALKFVKLAAPDKGGRVLIAACGLVRLSQSTCLTSNRDEANEIIRQALAKFLDQQVVDRGDVVAVNLPSSVTLPRLLMLPDSPPKKLLSLLTHEIPHQLPVPLEDLAWAYQAMGTDDTGRRAVAFLAARTVDVRNRLRPFEDAEIPVHILQSDAAANYNHAAHTLMEESSGALALLDIGSETSSLVIATPDSIWLRSLRLAGNDFTAAIVKQFQLTHAQAEIVKREPFRSKTFKPLADCLDLVFDRLVNQTQRSFESYRREVGRPVEQMYLLGGGARTFGLLRRFWSPM